MIVGVMSSPIVDAIKALYGITIDVNDFVDAHIEGLKSHANETIRATGRILEGAKFGFGLGYLTPTVLIAAGQYVLGNNLGAVVTVASGLTLSNPFSMTCASIGAVYFGWRALSEDERNAILNRLAEGFELGVELIKSIIAYVLSNMADFLSSEKLNAFKDFIASSANQFGKALYEVTGSVKDRIANAVDTITETASDVGEGISTLVEKGVGRLPRRGKKKANPLKLESSPAPQEKGTD